MAVAAGIYARISLDRSGEGLGVERQERDCRAVCADREWQVADVYVDNNLSGSKGLKRPQYLRLLADIESGRIGAVAVWDLDRLTRKPAELEHFVVVCDRAGLTQLAFVGGGVDMGTGDGLLIARVKGAVAAEEVRKNAARTARKKLDMAEKGEFAGGGTRPFGFEVDGVTVNEAEAGLIREAADRILEGATLYQIRQDWHARGFRSVTGKEWWSPQALKGSLIAPRMAGLRQHQGRVIGAAKWPAILDHDTWEQVRAILTDPSRTPKPVSRKYPLRGVLTCGVCDDERFLEAAPEKDRRYYGCKKSRGGCSKVFIHAGHVEKYIFDQVVEMYHQPNIRAAIEAEDHQDAAAARRLIKGKTEAQTKLVEIGEMLIDGDMGRDDYQRLRTKLQRRIDTAAEQLSSLRGGSILARLDEGWWEDWDRFEVDEQRLIVQGFIENVAVYPVRRRGMNRFDPERLQIWLRAEGLIRHLPEDYIDRDITVITSSELSPRPIQTKVPVSARDGALMEWAGLEPDRDPPDVDKVVPGACPVLDR